MSTSSLSQDANLLSDALRSTFQQIGRFSKLGSQPSHTTPSQAAGHVEDNFDTEDDARAEIAADIYESLEQHGESLDLLTLEVEDITAQGIRVSASTETGQWIQLVARVNRLSEDLKHARGQFRKAHLTVQRTAEAHHRHQRSHRFSALQKSYVASGQKRSEGTKADLFSARRKKHKELTGDELLIDASADLTRGLRQTHESLVAELSRSAFAQQTLAESTAALSELGQKYSGLDELLSTSKNLVGSLVKSQKTDTWYLETAFYLLCVTLGWLVFRRIIYGPAWWFVWLPLKHLLLRPVYWLLSTVGAGVASGAVGSAGFVATSTSASHSRSLRVQPSAVGGIPKFQDGYRPSVRAGAGGEGAKVAAGEEGRETVLEQIARMSEEGARHADVAQTGDMEGQGVAPPGEGTQKVGTQGKAGHGSEGDEVVVRGDGTVLSKRNEQTQPRNPKKKTFENEPPAQENAGNKDEL